MNFITGIKTLRFDVVDGSETKTFGRFIALFQSQANGRGYVELLRDTTTPVPVLADSATDPNKTIYENNIKGYCDLLTCCADHPEALAIVMRCKEETKYPEDNVKEALEALKSRFKKDDKSEKTGLRGNGITYGRKEKMTTQ